MSGFWIALDGGDMPDTWIDSDVMKARSMGIALDIAEASTNPRAVADLISEKVMGTGEHVQIRLLLAAGVIEEFTTIINGLALRNSEATRLALDAILTPRPRTSSKFPPTTTDPDAPGVDEE